MQTFTKLLFTAIGFITIHTCALAYTGNVSNPSNSILELEALSDTVETLINEPISFNVLTNDSGEGIYVNFSLQPSNGSLVWKLNGDFTYTPNNNYTGPDILVYQIRDAEGNTASANVFITVEGMEVLPLQVNIEYECMHDSTYDLWIYIVGGTPPYETLVQYGDDLVHPAYQNRLYFSDLYLSEIPSSMGFMVFVRDAENNTVLENHLLEILCHEDVVNACVAETHLELTPIISCNEGEKTIEVVASGGSGEYSYSGHFLEYSGDAVTVEDSEGCQNILFYDEVPAYTCPIAVDDVVNGAYNAPFHLKPLLNDTGDSLYISDISGLKHGTIQWKDDYFLAYYPNEGFAGIDTLEYEITDIAGNTSRAKILAVVPENDAVAIFWERDCSRAEEEGVYEINFTVAGGKPPYVIDGDFLANDYRGDEILSFVKADGDDFTITAIDKDNTAAIVQPSLSACTFLGYPSSDYTVYISCVAGESFGILTALPSNDEPTELIVSETQNGDTLLHGTNYLVEFEYGNTFEGTVFCPPIAEDDLYFNHPNFLQFPLTFNPLLNDNGHGLKLVGIETPNYGTLEWWKADGTVNYHPNADFQGVETFDYTLEDIGGNRTSATIKIVMAHPTELHITYKRDCYEVNNNGAENYTINAFVSGGKPPYQVQVNEEAFFEVTENGGDFSFEVANGEGFQIYAEDNGAVTHTATVEELEMEACSSLCEDLAIEVDLECFFGSGKGRLNYEVIGANGGFVLEGNEDGDILEIGEHYFIEIVDEQGCHTSETGQCSTEDLIVMINRDCSNAEETGIYKLEVAIIGGIPPFTISGSINETLDDYGIVSTEIEDGELYEITVVDAAGSEFYESGGEILCIVGCYNLYIENIGDIAECLCNGDMVLTFENIINPETALSIFGVWGDDNFAKEPELGDTIPANSFIDISAVIETENKCYDLFFEGEYGILGYTSDFCSPETYTLEAIDDFAVTSPGEPVTVNVLQNDTGTGLQISQILVAPSCGEILDANVTTGAIVYVVDANTTCTEDTFVYEAEDECENLVEATVTVFIEQGSDLIVQVERNCFNVAETGTYELTVTISSGIPPYTISGSINATLEEEGEISTTITDGNPYEITVTDNTGAELFEAGGETSCGHCLSNPLALESIEQIADCTCEGNMVVHFENTPISDEVISIEGTFGIGDTIPNDAYFDMYIAFTENHCYGIYLNGSPYIFGNVSDFCTPETYTIEAIDDFAVTSPGEPVTVNVLQNDTGTNLQINQILVSPSCGEIVDANVTTGDIVYVADANTTCTEDTFVYQAVDECGNLAQATVYINILQPIEDLDVQSEKDCSNAVELGYYVFNISVSGGLPPYNISGCINETLEEEGIIQLNVNVCIPCEITVIDSLGNQEKVSSLGTCPPICSEFPIDTNDAVQESFLECICDGSLIISFTPLAEVEEIQSIEGFWYENNQAIPIELGDTIPANTYFEIFEVQTDFTNYIVYTQENNFLGGFTSDFCAPQTPPSIPTLNESQSQTILCGEGDIILSLEGGGEGTTYNWYLDSDGTVPANPSTGQVWTNDELVGTGTVYVIAEDANGCQSEALGIETTRYEELRVENIETILSESCLEYQIVFDISGGNGEYTSNGIPVPAEFSSDWLATSSEDYSFEIDDNNQIFSCPSILIEGDAPDGDCFLSATGDFVTAMAGETVEIDVLQNDDGYELTVSAILQEPTCGTIINIDTETGIITYQADSDTECNTDYFMYEITDFWGNVTQASVTIFIPKENGELVVEITEDCSAVEETGFLVLYATISSGVPPFAISGSINKVLENYGQTFILLSAATSYEIQVIDSDGQEFTASNDTPCFNEELCANLQITPSYDCLITQTQDSIALLTYQTTGGDGNYSFNGNPQNDTLQNGDIYQIEVTDGNGCTAMVSDTIACNFTSIENPNPHSSIPNISLFPNPNNGNFTLSLELKQAEEVDIEILDVIGKVKLWQQLQTLPTVERQEFSINPNLNSGLYFIRLSGKDWTWTEKVVVD